MLNDVEKLDLFAVRSKYAELRRLWNSAWGERGGCGGGGLGVAVVGVPKPLRVRKQQERIRSNDRSILSFSVPLTSNGATFTFTVSCLD